MNDPANCILIYAVYAKAPVGDFLAGAYRHREHAVKHQQYVEYERGFSCYITEGEITGTEAVKTALLRIAKGETLLYIYQDYRAFLYLTVNQ